MSDGPISPDPPRLTREDDEAARLLERAEPRYRVGLDEARAWQRVERTRRRRVTLSWVATAGAVVAGALVFGSLLKSRTDPEVYALQAEPLSELVPAPTPATEPLKAELPPPLPEPEPARRALPRQPTPSAPPPAALPVSDSPPTESSCKKWLADGKPDRAVECFRVLSKNTGLDAEVALYEAARVSAEVLHDGTLALSLLEEHQDRFPASALRGEVDWLRVRSLQRSGQVDAALTESEALLATPTGRALSSELHALRGRLFQDQKQDCERAVREFVALVGEPGSLGDDAEWRRARCLESLGRSVDAEKAYEQYLSRANPQHTGEARARLDKLRE